ALLERLVASDRNDRRARVSLAKSLLLHSRMVLHTKSPEPVLAPARRAVELAASAEGSYTNDFERLQTLGPVFSMLADVLMALEKPAEAMPMYDKFIAVNEAYAAAHPTDIQGLKLLRNAYANVAVSSDPRLSKRADFERQSILMRKSLAVTETLLKI